MMEEIRQLKADKTKEKGSQHDLDHAADGVETLAGGVPRNVGQRFITMAEVAALLEQERADIGLKPGSIPTWDDMVDVF